MHGGPSVCLIQLLMVEVCGSGIVCQCFALRLVVLLVVLVVIVVVVVFVCDSNCSW